MSKSLVICIDGTWNAPGQTDKDPISQEEEVTKTNVMKTWEAVTQQSLCIDRPYGTIANLYWGTGEAMYLNGVGSQGSQHARNFEGTTGTGTSERIIDAYRFIAERWQPGDQIYVFGFSRGAYAARSAVGFLNHAGLPKNRSISKMEDLLTLFNAYKENTPAPEWTHHQAEVHFLGVWDTVGALAFGNSFNDFHQLSPANVRCFRQALALDEIRKQFVPEYWEGNDLCAKEVWFAGAHSNVGGGYVDANLSNVALFWLLQHAKLEGLALDLTQVEGWDADLPLGEIRDSYDEFWSGSALGHLIKASDAEQTIRTIKPNHGIHQSVFESAQTLGYQPKAQFADGSSALSGTQEQWRLIQEPAAV